MRSQVVGFTPGSRANEAILLSQHICSKHDGRRQTCVAGVSRLCQHRPGFHLTAGPRHDMSRGDAILFVCTRHAMFVRSTHVLEFQSVVHCQCIKARPLFHVSSCRWTSYSAMQRLRHALEGHFVTYFLAYISVARRHCLVIVRTNFQIRNNERERLGAL